MNQAVNMILNQQLRMHPEVQNDPRAMQMINALQSGDSNLGSQLATNICNSYGLDQATATNQAKNGLMSMFQGRR